MCAVELGADMLVLAVALAVALSAVPAIVALGDAVMAGPVVVALGPAAAAGSGVEPEAAAEAGSGMSACVPLSVLLTGPAPICRSFLLNTA